MTTPTPVSETPFMTVIDCRNPREKAHTKRGHAHAAIAQKVRSRYEGDRSKDPVRGILTSDASLHAYDGTGWVLLWEGKRGDDVTGKPWLKAQSPEVEPSITITLREYNSLKEDAAWVVALEACGVDNWIGYEDAVEVYEEATK